MDKYTRMVIMLSAVMLLVTACNLGRENMDSEQPLEQAQQGQNNQQPSPTMTDFPGDPLPTLTPSNTLRPPPTLEPPTLTPQPSLTPTITPTPTIQIQGNLPPLLGLYTDTPEPGEEGSGCEVREDWELFYEVQPGDALASIADKYNTFAIELAEGNCLDDPSLIIVGQMLRVPGEAHPGPPPLDCSWELLTPFNGTITVPGEGTITFNWNGPEAPRYLVRVYRNTDGTGDFYREFLTEFQTYYTMDLAELPEGGTYSWRVFPIGNDFLQIPCPESYHSIFTKAPAPTQNPNQQLPGSP